MVPEHVVFGAFETVPLLHNAFGAGMPTKITALNDEIRVRLNHIIHKPAKPLHLIVPELQMVQVRDHAKTDLLRKTAAGNRDGKRVLVNSDASGRYAQIFEKISPLHYLKTVLTGSPTG
jgi:hypothetical protein